MSIQVSENKKEAGNQSRKWLFDAVYTQAAVAFLFSLSHSLSP